ncbi:Proline 4-hydroxylase (includes Rps23 Pro-64 3,4-dihydroxylase Tpa1), contains SM-20 domain [Dyella jiangningensis]|uniref:2OG-Fe(II) oxygenase n=1 Tax=Dyella sp. AtDHG13 TaxID=1938897 RepID=UPI00087F2A1F|nr:2OG-Fe(II) oxygenase [Dyella sp. AtDHG13]PXV54692.1 Rps23 Pro-64 3,4-dihydroxylase Tpa1-like proline 4-hydroxylase [Dyella sp. AtDHG13]SDK88452.1 Proline 4-hydroxylase (includes Rps23 Pro-64 3,4-dihydroxylase Tpa1), contains SM-20 domain [Dyella jiangningensis]
MQGLRSLVNSDVLAREHDWQTRFASAQPFRHVIIDDFLVPEVADALLASFPSFESGNFIGDDGRPGGKSTVDRVRGLGEVYRQLDDVIKTREFLDFVGRITGIEQLIYDPFYLGGGTHENRHGQGLQAHIDFNYHPSERWHRRLNLIVYLNHEWDPAWGGMFDLYRDPYADASPQVRVPPLFNRCVIFETNEKSWHGFDPIDQPEDKRHLSRKSVALYFYSAERPEQETAGRHTTHYVNGQLPERVQPGYTLSEVDVAQLRQLIAQRDAQLRSLYEENSRLLQAQDKGIAGHMLYLLKRLYVRYRR